MLPSAFNCKKCPAQESANVCLAEAPKKLVQTNDGLNALSTAMAKSQSPSQTSHLNSKLQNQFEPTHLKSPESIGLSSNTAASAKFFAPKLDDRSNRSFEQQLNIVKAKVLVPLMLLHMFNQVPGIGSNSQALAEFEIKNGVVASIPPSALNFS